MKSLILDESRIGEAADIIISEFKRNKIFFLKGELGAGKTTLVQAVVKKLNSKDLVISPTFSIINSYYFDDKCIIHADLYRLESITELENTGFFEMLEDADIAFIEWADKFNLKDMLERYMEIRIIKHGETSRQYKFLPQGY